MSIIGRFYNQKPFFPLFSKRWKVKKIQLFCNICQIQAISHNLSSHFLYLRINFSDNLFVDELLFVLFYLFIRCIFWCIGLEDEASLHFFRSIVNWWFSCLAVRPTSICGEFHLPFTYFSWLSFSIHNVIESVKLRMNPLVTIWII